MPIKKLILFYPFILFLSGNVFSQAPNWLYAKSIGGSNYEESKALTIDGNGNVFMVGTFKSSSLAVGTYTFNNTSSYSSNDIIIVKYDPNGNLLWAKSFGGGGFDEGRGLDIDGSGNIYLTGGFGSSSIAFGTATLTNTYSSSFFLVKFDSNGSELWAKKVGENCNGTSITLSDIQGSIWITGEHCGAIIGSTTLNCISFPDIFVTKLDLNGYVIWTKGFGGNNSDYPNDISFDANGNVYVVGSFRSDSLALSSSTLLLSGTGAFPNMFIVKFDSNGNDLWAKKVGGNSSESANGIVEDGNGNVTVTGYYGSSSVAFGTITVYNSPGSNEIFLVNYDANGNAMWVKTAGGSQSDYSYNIAKDAFGNYYISGSFMSNDLTIGTTTLNHAGNGDIFIAKLGSSVTENSNLTNEQINPINLFPNPSSGQVTISFHQPFSSSVTGIEIYNVLGEKIYSMKHPVNIQTLDLSLYSEGLYYVQVLTEEKTYNRKLIICK